MDSEPITGCNFECTMCPVSSLNLKSKIVELENFYKIIKKDKQLIKIKLQDIG
jgi:hypothetical protein